MKLGEDMVGLRTLFMAGAATAFAGNRLCLVFDCAIRACEIEESPSAIKAVVFDRGLKCNGLFIGCTGGFKNQDCAFRKLSSLGKRAVRRAIDINIVREPG